MTAVQDYYDAESLSVATYDLQNHVLKTHYDGDVSFFLSLLGDPPRTVLELGVGTGRVALPLAEAGHQVAGVDLSAAMLKQAARKLSAGSAEIRDRVLLHQGNMVDVDLGRAFPLVIVPFFSFNHIRDPEDQRAALANIRRHLEPRARCVIHCFPPLDASLAITRDEPVREHMKLRLDAQKTTVEFAVIERHLDFVDQIMNQVTRFTAVADDGRRRVTEERVSFRWIGWAEMRWLCQCAGLAIDSALGNYAGARPGEGTEQIWVLRRDDD